MQNCLQFVMKSPSLFGLQYMKSCHIVTFLISNNSHICSKWHINFLGTIAKEEATKQMKTNKIDFTNFMKYFQADKQISTEAIENILKQIKLEHLMEDQIVHLLSYCGKSIPEISAYSRNQICQTIYHRLKTIDYKFTDKIYDVYIKKCTENHIALNIIEFLACISEQPSQTVYKLLLRNACENGDINEALKVVNEMKIRGIPLDEEIFNCLLMAQTIKCGIASCDPIFQSMKASKIPETDTTRFALIKGTAYRSNHEEFVTALQRYPIQFEEHQLLQLLETIGLAGNTSWIKDIVGLVEKESLTRDFQKDVEKLGIQLINMGKNESAINIYKTFVSLIPEINYAHSLLTEMVLCSAPTSSVIQICKELRDLGLNAYALESATFTALEHKQTDYAWALLKQFDTLRPHYFWPLFIIKNKESGELGIMQVVKEITELQLKLDPDTFESYILPYCDLSNPQRVLKCLQVYGYTVKELLSSIIVALMRNGETKLAFETYKSYDVQVIGNGSLFKLLPTTWIKTSDTETCVHFLQKICEISEENLIGIFLINVLRNSERLEGRHLGLLKEILDRKLRINPSFADRLIHIVRRKFRGSRLASKVEDAVDNLLDFGMKPEVAEITDPRNMNLDQLECHLLELKGKNMNTRGVLRKLIQKHSGLNNIERVQELENEFNTCGFQESPGMMSSLMFAYIRGGNVERALKKYAELKEHPAFVLDEFKVIDLATLLIKNNMIDEGFKILKNESEGRNVTGGPKIERSCRELLLTVTDSERQMEIFSFLVKYRYCKPTNVLLGTLIRTHLNDNNLVEAVELYEKFAKEHNCTPLQLEIFCATLELEDTALFQKALDATASIHGNVAAVEAFIAALCEKGFTKPLERLLMENKNYVSKNLEKRCERWVNEGKLNALQTLLNASRNTSTKAVNLQKIYISILQIYSNNNDHEAALAFWEELVKNEELVIPDVEVELNSLLKRCKVPIPNALKVEL